LASCELFLVTVPSSTKKIRLEAQVDGKLVG
jgi:hypothetical protein